MKIYLFLPYVVATALLFSVAPLQAQTSWTGSENENWSEADNWSPTGVPSGADLSFDGTAARFTIDLGGDTQQPGGDLTFNSNQLYTLQNGTLNLAGTGQAHDITNEGSADVVFDAVVDLAAGSGGRTLTVNGDGSLIFNGSLNRLLQGLDIAGAGDGRVVLGGDSMNSLGSATIRLQDGMTLELAKTTVAAQNNALAGGGTISIRDNSVLRVTTTPAVIANTIEVVAGNGTISGDQTITITGDFTHNRNRTVTFLNTVKATIEGDVYRTNPDVSNSFGFAGTGDVEFTGIIRDFDGPSDNPAENIRLSGSGVFQFSNPASTYTGETRISDSRILEVVKLSDGGEASSIGQSTNDAANLYFEGGTLRYTGSGDSTDRNFTLTNAGATLESSGTGALMMTGTTMNHEGGGGRTLTLGGTYEGGNSLAVAITDNATQATNLIKAGEADWTLTGVSTYTGSTVINAGTLAVAPTGSINQTSGVTLDGATAAFRYNSSTNFSQTFTWTEGRLEGTNWNGTLGGLTVGADQTISPSNSPGTANTTSQTWDPGGTYLWEINDANGTAGAATGWDLVLGSDTLDITATSGDPFTIMITSLTLANSSGDAANFNSTSAYQWLIADFDNPISGFDAEKFALNTSDFTNSINGGFFSIMLGDDPFISGGNDTQIYLAYIPEPSALLLLAFGGVLLALRRRRTQA